MKIHEERTTKDGRRLAIVSVASKMPMNCKGRYRYSAIVELADGYDAAGVTMISERSKAVKAIIYKTPDLHAGGTKSAFSTAIAELSDRIGVM